MSINGSGINGGISDSNGVGIVDSPFKERLGQASLMTRTILNAYLCQTRASMHPQMSEDDRKFPDDSLAAIELLRELWQEHHPMQPGYGQAVLEVQNTLHDLAQADMTA